tara:strand:+ start:732 stop:1868 length:1137 start_codon:yes stop_codon:yes gene_type:complete
MKKRDILILLIIILSSCTQQPLEDDIIEEDNIEIDHKRGCVYLFDCDDMECEEGRTPICNTIVQICICETKEQKEERISKYTGRRADEKKISEEKLDLKEREPIPGAGGSRYISLYNNELYWSSGYPRSISKISILGGTPTVIKEELSDSDAMEILASSDFVYIVDGSSLKKIDMSGNLLWKTPGSTFKGDIEEDSTHIYTVRNSVEVLKISKADGKETVLKSGTETWDVAVDENYVYYTEYRSTSVKKVPKSGGDVEVLYAGEKTSPSTGGRKIEVDDKNVYWFDGIGTIYSMPKSGDEPTELHQSGGLLFDIKLEGDYVYTLSSDSFGDNGKIVKIKKDGSESIILFKGIESYSEMALDSGNIYFYESGKIYVIKE